MEEPEFNRVRTNKKRVMLNESDEDMQNELDVSGSAAKENKNIANMIKKIKPST